jgi:hypothetical protein
MGTMKTITALLSICRPLLAIVAGSLCWSAAAQAQAPGTFGNEYELIGYNTGPQNNRISRLQARIASGEVKLEYREKRGYLDSLLENLEINPSSQVLVFSKTSLQYQLIDDHTPRALFFNEDTYIGFVQHSQIVEVMTMDDNLGMLFFVFNNKPRPEEYFTRETQRCLVCHDTAGTMGGGVPMVMALSSIYNSNLISQGELSGAGNVEDRMPVRDRWGGWYVTGQSGSQVHMGNLILPGAGDLALIDDYRRGNVDTLEELGMLDPTPYPSNTSDIVSLMLLEHQLTVQNMLTYVTFKAPAVLDRAGFPEYKTATSWAELPERAQRSLTRMMDRLADTLLMADATTFEDRISGREDFQAWFTNQGPHDSRGRSLRELDLQTRLFRYPLSYLVYSEAFRTLPAYATDYIHTRLRAVLNGDIRIDHPYNHEEREAALAILDATWAPSSMPLASGHWQ